ncbi:MAG: hypothetical protein P4L44_04520 [Oryzomonas sp.]|uniref:hypothetical protein n=1 Tax=Oryzomonas sp. TaxID=2855186 RepID=UPI0028435DE3|nr:hypothetical protein [Oryzomonas sp.]MDR3579212.1 hypothetical protein [Oryzomonas sp.]
MNLKLGSWPFPAGMPAHLCWVKSPRQVGRDKQWQQKVLFQGQNGMFHERMLPWGVVPALKLGVQFVNGEVSGRSSAGDVKVFRLGDTATCRFTSSDYLRNEWLDRVREYQRQLLVEHCVCIEDGETRLWMPCIEVARAFFAINKQLAYLLLDPMGLSKICSSELEGGKVRVHFNKEMPVASINKLLAARVATIRHHAPWDGAWRQVWNRSIKNPGEPTVYSQLYCCPPTVNGSTWSVRGIQCENGFFVLEIRGIRTQAKLPFDEVAYTHPHLTFSPDGGESAEACDGSGSGGGSREEHSDDGEIDSGTLPPKRSRNPLHGPMAVSFMEFGNGVKVLRHCGEGWPKPRRSKVPEGGEGGEVEVTATKLKGPVRVSLNDDGGLGEILAAEFKPIEELVDVPPGLKSFITAVKGMKKVKVACTIKAVPDESPLAKLHDGQRHFVLVHVRAFGRWPGKGYVLEIDSSDGHRVSTLVFLPKGDFHALDTANKMLKECFAKGRYWTSDTIKNEETVLKYELVRHRLLEPVHWGGRLRSKINLLDGDIPENARISLMDQ